MQEVVGEMYKYIADRRQHWIWDSVSIVASFHKSGIPNHDALDVGRHAIYSERFVASS